MFRIKTMWPFPARAVASLAERMKALVVPELNMGQVSHVVARVVEGRCPVVPINRVDSEMMSPKEIIKAMKDL
jgi:2-oxoglutarate ferredoxin oxidoreductase subunit alpha